MPDAVRLAPLRVRRPHAEPVLPFRERIELERVVAGREVLERPLAHLPVLADALEMHVEPERIVEEAHLGMVPVRHIERNFHAVLRRKGRHDIVGRDVGELEVLRRDVPIPRKGFCCLANVGRVSELSRDDRRRKGGQGREDYKNRNPLHISGFGILHFLSFRPTMPDVNTTIPWRYRTPCPKMVVK